jgi:Flp pilus assembly protein TadD
MAASSRLTDRLVAAALVAAVFLVYQPCWQGGLIWDDDVHVAAAVLRSWRGLYRIWFDVGATLQYYPLLHTALWVERRLWGDAVLGYHLLNIGLHGLTAILAWVGLRRLKVPGAPLAAAIFALHPVHVESVAWIAEQKNTLSAVFYLAAMIVYLRFDQSRKATSYVGAFGLFVLALLSKTVTATLPGALLVIFWWQRGRLSWRRDAVPLLPFFLVGAGTGMITAWWELQYNQCVGPEFDMTWVQRTLLAGRATWFHAAKIFWPVHLTFVYPRWQVDSGAAWQYVFPLAAAVLLALLWAIRRWTRAPLAAALYFGGTLFPTLGFFNLYTFRYSLVANHYQYLASLGIIAPVAAGAALLSRRWPIWGSRAGYALCFVMLAILGVMSSRQSRMYTDIETLYRTTIAENPGCWMAHNNLGVALADRGKFGEAIPHYRKAIRLDDRNSAVHNNLGSALAAQGKVEEAISHYREAIRLDERNSAAHDNLGIALAAQGRFEAAISHFREAIRLDDENGAAHNNLGNALAAQGKVEEAISHFREAIRLDDENSKAHDNLGMALVRLGRVDEAIGEYEIVLRTRPDDAKTLNNIAWIRSTHPDPRFRDGAEAVSLARRAVELSPDDPDCFDTLAAAYAEVGRFPEAGEAARKAVELAGRQNRQALAESIGARLRLYEAGTPFRETPSPPPLSAGSH